jgi:hypothetical protein
MLVSDRSDHSIVQRQRPQRPPPCRQCKQRSWWNGWRRVFAVVASLLDGVIGRQERWLPRAKCSSCRRGFTCYPADHYPHRQYQLDVVAAVTAAVAIGGGSAGKAAAMVTASATSARRWSAWVAGLAAPEVLLATAQKLDPDAPVGAGLSATGTLTPRQAKVALVLAALEQVGAALVRRGLELMVRTGLGRVLHWQYRAHGDVAHLVCEPRSLSPAMASQVPAGAM